MTRILNAPANLIVLVAGALWALKPVTILVLGAEFFSDRYSLTTIMMASEVAATCLILLFLKERLELFKRARALESLDKMWGGACCHGVLAALAFFLLVNSSQSANLSVNAVLFEAWPLYVVIILSLVSPKPGDRHWTVFPATVLFIVGLVMIQLDNGGFDSGQILGNGALIALVSGVAMGVGTSIVQIFVRRKDLVVTLTDVVVFNGLRQVVTVIAFALMSWASGASVTLDDPTILPATIVIGVLTTCHSVLFHYGYARTDQNVAGLFSLVAPVLAPFTLLVLGFGVVTKLFLSGSALILAAIALAIRAKAATTQFVVLLVGLCGFGVVVVLTEGQPLENYLDYLQAIAVFYGLLGGFALNRQIELYRRLNDWGVEIAREYHAPSIEGLSDNIQDRLNRIGLMKRETGALAELVMLTLLAGSLIFFAIVFRPLGWEAAAAAYVMSTSILFMTTLGWRYQHMIMTYRIPHPFIASRKLRTTITESIISYAILISVFIWFVVVIALNFQTAMLP